MKVKVPQKIKLLTHTYDVEFNKQELSSAGTIGLCQHIYGKIIVGNNFPLSQMNQSFLHEYMHLVERFLVVKLDDTDIDRIAEGIAVLLENLGIELDWSDIKELKI